MTLGLSFLIYEIKELHYLISKVHPNINISSSPMARFLTETRIFFPFNFDIFSIPKSTTILNLKISLRLMGLTWVLKANKYTFL